MSFHTFTYHKPLDSTDDELIYNPGLWKYRDGTKGFRITRIYVSSKASTFNGKLFFSSCLFPVLFPKDKCPIASSSFSLSLSLACSGTLCLRFTLTSDRTQELEYPQYVPCTPVLFLALKDVPQNK